jgi:ATP-binding cassette subfamily C protein CydC
MKSLWRIVTLWRAQILLMAAGIAISLLALAANLGLLAASGHMVMQAGIAATGSAGVLIALRILGPARVVLRYIERLVSHSATFKALAKLRIWFFQRLAENSAGGLGLRDAGDMLSRLVSDVDQLDGIYLRLMLPLCGAFLVVPAATWLALRINQPIGFAVLALLLSAAFLLPALGYFAAQALGQRLTRAQSSLRVAGLDSLTGLREIWAYAAQSRALARVTAAEEQLIATQRSLARRAAFAQVSAQFCAQGALLAILAATHASASAKFAAAFVAIAGFEAIGALPRAGLAAGSAAASAERVLEAAEFAPLSPDPQTPAPLPEGRGLAFDAVHFSWAPDRPSVLRGLSMEITAGSRIAILGPSGAGKSTLAALMLRIASPQSGRILLGGTDIATLKAEELRHQIAWLGQTSHLFADTIRANLLLADPDASDTALWLALDRAGIGETIRALPDQLNTFLGEGGARLSGGQGRRVALARTLLSASPIIILDEPCTGLDAETEREFLKTFFAETRHRTVILIVHRLTGVEKLDRIWRLSNGLAVAALA